MRKKIITSVLFFVLVTVAFNCAAGSIRMSTTTSTENSGLLDVLLPAFEKKSGIRINAIAAGTGKALKLAENGDVDLVMVHCPRLEADFMEKGFGLERKAVFYNDFVITGPEKDEAKARDTKNAAEAFRMIFLKGSAFISRGDDSGTYRKETEIWNRAGIPPEGAWYIETGQGMGATLIIADEKEGYCLVDRGTFISFQDKIGLVILYEGDPLLINPYSVITVNPAAHAHAKYGEAKAFLDWLTSAEGKAVIDGFRKNGEQLFHTYK